MRRLRALGYECALMDVRDAAGARLHPPNLRLSCGLLVLCRRASYRLHADQTVDRAFLSAHPGALLQVGADDIGQLLQALKLRNMKHWNDS